MGYVTGPCPVLSNLTLPLPAGESGEAAHACLSPEAARTGEHTHLSQEAAREKWGTACAASWELALCSRSKLPGWSQRSPSTHGGLWLGGNTKSLDPIHVWLCMPTSSPTITVVGPPRELKVRWGWGVQPSKHLTRVRPGGMAHESHTPLQCGHMPEVHQQGTDMLFNPE